MKRFLARHPFLAASLLLLPYPAIAWGVSFLTLWSLDALGLGYKSCGGLFGLLTWLDWLGKVYFRCHGGTAFAWPALVCFLVALMRRRVGIPARPLYWLAAPCAMETGTLFFASFVVVFHAASKELGIYAVIASAFAAMGSAFGIWIGTALADRFRNRGRWEMIQPVPRPGRAQP